MQHALRRAGNIILATVGNASKSILVVDTVLNKEAVRFWIGSRAESAVQQFSRGFDDHPQLVKCLL
jgi:hypothetical protein